MKQTQVSKRNAVFVPVPARSTRPQVKDPMKKKVPAKLLDRSSTVSKANASDEQYQELQLAFDATSRLTLACKRLLTDVAANISSRKASEFAAKGKEYLMALVKPSEAIESLLIASRETVTAHQAAKAYNPNQRNANEMNLVIVFCIIKC